MERGASRATKRTGLAVLLKEKRRLCRGKGGKERDRREPRIFFEVFLAGERDTKWLTTLAGKSDARPRLLKKKRGNLGRGGGGGREGSGRCARPFGPSDGGERRAVGTPKKRIHYSFLQKRGLAAKGERRRGKRGRLFRLREV